jgi:hypothetical protein
MQRHIMILRGDLRSRQAVSRKIIGKLTRSRYEYWGREQDGGTSGTMKKYLKLIRNPLFHHRQSAR